MSDIQSLVAKYCAESGLDVRLSFEMPDGYETAFGTYVPDTQTLHLNAAALKDAPQADARFYLCHELRHAEQYQHPERFSDAIQRSLPYVILYNGSCFKQDNGHWRHCKFDGEDDYFTAAYLSLPYELDANLYALRQLDAEDACASATALRSMWIPEQPLSPEEFEALFKRIDEALN